ncbi:hypothetical protein HV241_10020 [Citrobacter freundii]|jgi:hypothetical protein|uniref:hypothetical protein n=1 Tax=Citrobacter freundii TaxID=546 RepID=UPI0015E9517E|nr:hypothetical protein [Citrobacter freundii]QLY69348.1 hypothetical protein HV241_10020 [Citrobacter freundii]
MEEKTMSVGALLEEISKLREDVNTLTVAFSYLAFAIPESQMKLTLTSLQYESTNPRWSSQQQNSFKHLAKEIEERLGSSITIL